MLLFQNESLCETFYVKMSLNWFAPVCETLVKISDWFLTKTQFNKDEKGNFEMHLLTGQLSIVIVLV